MNDTRYKVGLFVPCCIDQFAAGTAWKALRLLEAMGLECYYPTAFTCCGRELYNQGDREGAKMLGEKLIELYSECTHVVSCSSACVVYAQKQFPKLFHNTTLHNSYRLFVDKFYDISDFLVNVLHVDSASSEFRIPQFSFPHTVTVMDHCTTLSEYLCSAHPELPGLREEPRRLLRAVGGLTLVEMQQQDVCCGFGGFFASQFTPISDSLAQRKCENAIAAGAEYIVSTEPGCLLHLQSYIDKNGLPLKCAHLMDVLNSD